jgi:CheY-like chemotaxis protein
MNSDRVVLAVDDDLNDRTLLRYAFKKAATPVDFRMVKDAFQAEEYLLGRGAYADRIANPLPCLMLLDLKLPRRSGLEFLAWKQDQPATASIPVIVLSSSQEGCDIERAYDLGARSYLVKSVDLKELMKIAEGIGAYVALLSRKSEVEPAR